MSESLLSQLPDPDDWPEIELERGVLACLLIDPGRVPAADKPGILPSGRLGRPF